MPLGLQTLIRPEYQHLFQGDVNGPTLKAVYYVSSSKLSLRSAAYDMAATISCGLDVHFDYLRKDSQNLQRCCPKVSAVSFGGTPKEGHIELTLPLESMIENKRLDITQILNLIYGDFFEEQQLTRIKLTDVTFSPEAIDYFKGPFWGIEKIRDALKTSEDQRPHIGVVPHPPIGVNAEKYAQQCFRLAQAGADHIVDSDILTNPHYCSIEDRVTLVIEAIEKSRGETKKIALYSVNITSDVDRLLENADKAVGACGKGDLVALGICVANTGLSALSMLRKYVEQKGNPIHVHVTGLPLMTRDNTFGIDYRVFNTLVRLLGADIIHIPSLTGRYVFEDVSPEEAASEALQNSEVLNKDFSGKSSERIKKVFPMLAGGINPVNAEYHLRLFGNDVILIAGASLFREPPGPERDFKTIQSIVRSLRQIIDIVTNGEYVNTVMARNDKRKYSKFKDLASFWDVHTKEFEAWDWRETRPSNAKTSEI